MTPWREIRRVTLVSPYALSVYGGVQEQVFAMSRELTRRDVTVQIVAPDASDGAAHDTPARIERFGSMVRVPANGSRAPLTLSARASREAAHCIAGFNPHVVHFHEPFAPRVGWQTLRRHRAPAVGTFHRSGDGPALSLAAPLLRHWSSRLDAAVAVSATAAATARAAYGVSPTVLFNGFETSRFLEFAREPQSVITIVVVGRLEERKGVATAVAAVLAHNARHEEPWRLVVIGDGPQGDALRAVAPGDPHVVFLGAIADAEKRRWYRRANVVVAPATRGESFGLILLEAMASETPVVASDIAGYRDAAGVHAVLFRAGDASSLEGALTRALSTPQWDPAPAREHAQNWSMARLVDDYFSVYQRASERFRALR